MPVTEMGLLFCDLETTGLVPGRDEPIEIASILTDWKLNEVARFHEKIQFDHSKMSPEAAAVNGYDPKVWAYEAIPYFKYDAWLQKNIPYPGVAVPVGSNPRFDREILYERYYKPSGKFFKWSFHMINTCDLALTLKAAGIIDVPNVKLGTVCEALKIETDTMHRAMSDAEAAKKVFEYVIGILQA